MSTATNEPIRIEFAEQLRGKNALHFVIGLGIIIALIYATLTGVFTRAGLWLGWIDPPQTADGYSAGITDLGIDLVCLVGFGGVTVFKLCWRWLGALAERLSFISAGVYAWSTKEQTTPEPGVLSIAEPSVTTAQHARLTDAVASIERRLRELTETVNAHGSALDSVEEWLDVMDPPPPPPKSPEETIAAFRAEVDQLRAAMIAPQTAAATTDEAAE